MTTITWTPGQLVLPHRGPILPPAEELAGEQPAVIGTDGRPDTLLPGDPVHEPAGIDPEDTAARMLISFMNFLEQGDVTTFAPPDRRDWTLEVLSSINRSKQALTDSELPVGTQDIPEGHHHFTMSQQRAQAAAERIGGAKDWRSALLALRTMHPGAGNYSGVGVELDSAESQLYKRIVDMRTTLNDVVKRQADKFQQKLNKSRAKAAYREKLIIAAKLKAEAEEAERLRKEAEELAERERIKAEELAKLAAMRAAKAARKLAGDDSSDSDEDGDDDLDIVNPYASLMGDSFNDAKNTSYEVNEEDDDD